MLCTSKTAPPNPKRREGKNKLEGKNAGKVTFACTLDNYKKLKASPNCIIRELYRLCVHFVEVINVKNLSHFKYSFRRDETEHE